MITALSVAKAYAAAQKGVGGLGSEGAAAADHAAAAAATMEDNPIDFQAMATEQKSCAETQKLIAGPTALTISFHSVGGAKLAGDTSTGTWQRGGFSGVIAEIGSA